jgi:hypothetical protein
LLHYQKGKLLGGDGLLKIFFQNITPLMALAFFEVFRGILEQGNMLPYLCSGEIILIPKFKDHSHIGN